MSFFVYSSTRNANLWLGAARWLQSVRSQKRQLVPTGTAIFWGSTEGMSSAYARCLASDAWVLALPRRLAHAEDVRAVVAEEVSDEARGQDVPSRSSRLMGIFTSSGRCARTW